MFQWKEEFSVKVRRFDEQHQQLFSLGNHLMDALHAGKDADHYDEILRAFNELKQYAQDHFQAEEQLMEQHGYPRLMSHKMQHKKFLAQMDSIANQDVDENQLEVMMELLRFLADWIQNHILVVDSRYSDFFNEKGEY